MLDRRLYRNVPSIAHPPKAKREHRSLPAIGPPASIDKRGGGRRRNRMRSDPPRIPPPVRRARAPLAPPAPRLPLVLRRRLHSDRDAPEFLAASGRLVPPAGPLSLPHTHSLPLSLSASLFPPSPSGSACRSRRRRRPRSRRADANTSEKSGAPNRASASDSTQRAYFAGAYVCMTKLVRVCVWCGWALRTPVGARIQLACAYSRRVGRLPDCARACVLANWRACLRARVCSSVGKERRRVRGEGKGDRGGNGAGRKELGGSFRIGNG